MSARESVPSLKGLVQRAVAEGVFEAPVPEEAARRRSERIRSLMGVVAENLSMILDLVRQAKAAEDHIALGYPSWTAYVADMLGDEPLRLARDVRRELVGDLAEMGMSTRAIAPLVGVSHVQVARDIEAAATDVTPEPAADAVTGEIAEPPTPPSAPAPITGLDGKTYERPTVKASPKPPEERALTAVDRSLDAAADAVTGVLVLDPLPEALTSDALAEWIRLVTVALAGLRKLSDRLAEAGR